MWYVSLYLCIHYQGWILGTLIYVAVYVIFNLMLKKLFKISPMSASDLIFFYDDYR